MVLSFPKHAGFTLVEILVYIALLVMVMAVAIGVLLSLREPLAQQMASRLLYTNADYIMTQFTDTARNADSVDVSASTFGSTPGAVTLMTDGIEVEYALTAGELVRSVDGIIEGALNNDAVTVDGLVVRQLVNTATEGLRFEVGLTATANEVTKHATYTTSVMLRHSYE